MKLDLNLTCAKSLAQHSVQFNYPMTLIKKKRNKNYDGFITVSLKKVFLNLTNNKGKQNDSKSKCCL